MATLLRRCGDAVCSLSGDHSLKNSPRDPRLSKLAFPNPWTASPTDRTASCAASASGTAALYGGRTSMPSPVQQVLQQSAVSLLKTSPLLESDPEESALKKESSLIEDIRHVLEDQCSAGRNGGAGSRLRVAVDVDEVLGCFLKTLNHFCEEEYKIFHELEEFYVYDFKKVWNCSQLEANHMVHEFFKSRHFNEGIPTIPGAVEALQRLSPHCDFVVVTSRQHVIQDATLQWLEKHFHGMFSEIHFGNHFALEGKAKPKAEICREIGATVLIDDNPGYAMECAQHGMKVLLFDWDLKYAWSKTKDGPTHDLITRVQDWRQVEEELLLHVRA